MSDDGLSGGRRATVIIPAYNEEEALPAVLRAVDPLRKRGIEVIVVDDGSTDGTADVARSAGYRVVRLPRNSGKAAAMRAGLAAAAGDKIVLIDADATYPADAIPSILALLDDFDIVLGSRIHGRAHIPLLNRFGNASLRTVIHLFSGFRSADPLTGLYGVRRQHLEAMHLDSRGFGLEAEICVKAARMGLRAADHPIAYGERIGESKLNPLHDGVLIAWTIIRALFTGPRLRPARGRAERVRPAPLALGTTAASLILLTVAAITLGALVVLSTASLVDPRIPLTDAISVPGIAAFAAGMVLWRLAHRWGRPGPRLLGRFAAAASAAGALLVAAGVLGADALGILPSSPGIALTQQVLLAGAVVVLVLAPASAVAGPRIAATAARLTASFPGAATLRRHAELAALCAILIFFAVPVVRFIAIAPVIGFDEAIYANTARSWLEGTPNTGWSSHRSPGISVLGLPAVPFSSEAAYRIVGLVSGALVVVGAWALARRVGGPAAGLIAALAVAAVPELRLNSGFFLTDVPSAAIVLGLMWLVWTQLEDRPAPTNGFVWLAPLAAAAFYVRYGASIPIMLVAATAILLWPRRIIASWRVCGVTAGLLLLLLVPHFIQATVQQGAPWGIAMTAQALASPDYPGQALLTYLRLLPEGLAGPVGGLLIILAVGAWPIMLSRDGLRTRAARGHTFLVLPALAQLILLGVVALAGVRYILLPIVLLLIAGTLVGARLSGRLSASWRRSLAAVTVISIVASSLAASAVEMRRQAEHAVTQRDLIDLGNVIRRDADGRTCAILGYPPPQITWYSGCATHHFGFPPQGGREELLKGERQYLVIAERPGDRYPTGNLLERYRDLADPEPMAIVRDRVTDEAEYAVHRITTDP